MSLFPKKVEYPFN